MVTAQRPAHQPPPRRVAQDDFKKATILRAEGGRLHGHVRRHRRREYDLLGPSC